jgi:two-component sensor histidine kinase/DNA-binding response OmpR family regulator
MATILIVDDRPTNRQFLLALLGYGGHRLLEAADGSEALALARSEQPDLVVTDILMPTMDGYQFVRQMRAEPDIAVTPVIFYSATYSVPEARAMAETCGVKTVLPKPSDPQVILDAVNRELGLADSDRTVIPEEQQVRGATELHELHRIGERIDTYLTDLHTTKDLISGIVDRADQLFKDRERLRPLSERFAENITNLQGITARLAALEELTLRLVAERSPGPMVEQFVRASARIIGASRAVVCVLDAREEAVAHIAAIGLDPKTLLSLALDRTELPGSLLGIQGPLRLSVEDATLRPLPAGLAAQGAFLGLPIRGGAHLYGWLCFTGRLGAPEFTTDDERIAVSMAAQLAVVYENTLLYDTVQRHAAQLSVALKEIHHRVKNNMQVISSLLRLESRRTENDATKEAFNNMQGRIQSMALLHETLYREGNISQVDLGAYLRDLARQLSRSVVAAPSQVALRLDVVPAALSLEQAIPCGLIANELVSNAFKHGFPNGRHGEIWIELRVLEDGVLRLRIRDDGIGVPEDFEARRASSLGLQLVTDLSRQLGGRLDIGTGPGSSFDLTFSPQVREEAGVPTGSRPRPLLSPATEAVPSPPKD